MKRVQIEAVGSANPPRRFSQDEAFQMAGYTSPRILEIFRNCDIDFRHFHVSPGQTRDETPGDLNQRYLSGAMETGCRAIAACLSAARTEVSDIDCFVVCSSTRYVCPDLGSRLIAHMGFRSDIRRAALVGLGCAGALPALQQAYNFVRAHPNGKALMLAVEICSACYFVDDTMDTVVGNAICADGAAAFLITSPFEKKPSSPELLDFESCIASEHIEKVGFEHKDSKLRIVLANAVRHLAGPLIESALNASGHGVLLDSILRSNPSLTGILFDSRPVIESTPPPSVRPGEGKRRTNVGGDFFESVPMGADIYILKNVLHDWNDDRAVHILRNCRRAMSSWSKLLVIEMVLPMADDPVFGSLLDLNMLVMSGGRERTRDEYFNLLKSSGFGQTRVVPTPSPVSIVEATPL